MICNNCDKYTLNHNLTFSINEGFLCRLCEKKRGYDESD